MADTGYKIRDQYAMHYLTMTIVGWVDVFTRQEMKSIIIDSFNYCIANKGLQLYAYVIMSNHIHIIAKAKEDTNGLLDIIRDMKKHTSKQIINWIGSSGKESRKEWIQMVFQYHAKENANNTTYQVWQQDNQPKEIVRRAFGMQNLNYIHQNPVTAGYVDLPEHYKYSSYRSYIKSDLDVLLPIIPLVFGPEEGFIHVPNYE